MSGLETAIRNALDRSDRGNPETRARIYQSARLALESGLRKQDVTDPEIVSQQRQRLETIIHAIETEERFALGSTAGKVVPPVVAPVQKPADSRPASTEPVRAPEPVAVQSTSGDRARLRDDLPKDRAAPGVEIERDSRPQRRFWGGAQSAAAPGFRSLGGARQRSAGRNAG